MYRETSVSPPSNAMIGESSLILDFGPIVFVIDQRG
jgi:hypothetical protein